MVMAVWCNIHWLDVFSYEMLCSFSRNVKTAPSTPDVESRGLISPASRHAESTGQIDMAAAVAGTGSTGGGTATSSPTSPTTQTTTTATNSSSGKSKDSKHRSPHDDRPNRLELVFKCMHRYFASLHVFIVIFLYYYYMEKAKSIFVYFSVCNLVGSTMGFSTYWCCIVLSLSISLQHLSVKCRKNEILLHVKKKFQF